MPKVKNEVLEFCTRHNACQDGKDWALTCETLADVFDKCHRGDWMMWMLRKGGKIDKPTAVKLACEFALRVLPIYEKRYARKEPRLAIEAALAWVADPSEEKRRAAAYAAAAAADAAADAAYAAYAAAADAYAADAYAAAADAADAARKTARTAEQLAQADLIRKTVANPWRE